MEDNINANNETNSHKTTSIRGMFRDWFLDYASYVILERAVPHINDGLKQEAGSASYPALHERA